MIEAFSFLPKALFWSSEGNPRVGQPTRMGKPMDDREQQTEIYSLYGSSQNKCIHSAKVYQHLAPNMNKYAYTE